jgi:hypothetical protein
MRSCGLPGSSLNETACRKPDKPRVAGEQKEAPPHSREFDVTL